MTENQKDNRNQQDPEKGKKNIEDPSTKTSEVPFNSELEDSEEKEEETIKEDESLIDSELDDTERKARSQKRKNDSI